MPQKLITPRLRFGETVDARAYSTEDPPIKYINETTIECSGTPTEDWLRRQAIATIRRLLLQPDLEKTYALDKDYRGNHKHCTDLPAQLSLTPKLQPIAIPVDQNENASTTNHRHKYPRKILTAPPTNLSSQATSQLHLIQSKST